MVHRGGVTRQIPSLESLDRNLFSWVLFHAGGTFVVRLTPLFNFSSRTPIYLFQKICLCTVLCGPFITPPSWYIYEMTIARSIPNPQLFATICIVFQTPPHMHRWYRRSRWSLQKNLPKRCMPDYRDECERHDRQTRKDCPSKEQSDVAFDYDGGGGHLHRSWNDRKGLWGKIGYLFRTESGMDCDCKWCKALGSGRCGALLRMKPRGGVII